MNNSAIPSRLTVLFSASGDKNTIPVNSTSETLADGLAAMDSGFPPLTRIALSAGGKPPRGQDFNGIFNDVYTRLQWSAAGAGYPFSNEFSTAISGYPKGAIVPASDYSGGWLNLNNGNTVNPESLSGAPTGWVPNSSYGITAISGISGSSITLSSLQAAKERIILTGTLTANINLIFPEWIKGWVVHNNCTGPYSITCKTSSGSGVVVIPGLVSRIFCDGVNITDETMSTQTDLVGSVVGFAVNTPPAGWLAANGQAVSRNIYARLFLRIGTLWGAGDGSTTFNLPDYRGEFIRGWDNGRGVDPGRGLATPQNATQIVDYAGSADGSAIQVGIINGEGSSPDSTWQRYRGTATSSYGANRISVRPRNIAALYCIKF